MLNPSGNDRREVITAVVPEKIAMIPLVVVVERLFKEVTAARKQTKDRGGALGMTILSCLSFSALI